MLRRLIALVMLSMFSVAAVACEKEGPAEKAGKEVDKAAEQAGKKIEELGEKLKQ